MKKGRTKTPPSEAWPLWTEARFWQYIRSALRRAWSRFPARYATLADAKMPYTGNNKLQKFCYKCAVCENTFQQKQVEVDHIIPCGTLSSWGDLESFCKKLFCSKEGLRVVCKPCHKALTSKK